jgi:hypothetical protein
MARIPLHHAAHGPEGRWWGRRCAADRTLQSSVGGIIYLGSFRSKRSDNCAGTDRTLPDDQITGRQIAAGRVLAGVGREKLARLAEISVPTLRRIEAARGPVGGLVDNPGAVTQALEKLGVRFIPENGGGVGVRLKFTASDVRRINTLESEGGIVGEDDV